MTELMYLLSIIGAVSIAGLTLRHAWGDSERLAFFGTATVYGFLLELTVLALFGFHSYPAGHGPLLPWNVPIAIPLAWGVIMYASLMAGRHLGLRRGQLPVFAGLFVLHIDLAIDAIAIRIPFWTWHLPGIWFDVPIVNFVGWYSVALLFTGCFLYLEANIENYALVGLISLATSTALLTIIIDVWLRFVAPSTAIEALVFGVIIAASLVYLTRLEIRPGLHLDRFPTETFASVLMIHLFYLQTNLYYGYYRDSPRLLYVGIAMLLVGIGVHYLPYRSSFATDEIVSYRRN